MRDPRALLLIFPLMMGSGSHLSNPMIHNDVSIDRYASDLVGKDKSDRLYAARHLRSELRSVIKTSERAPEDTLTFDELMAKLDDYDTIVAPACMKALKVENTRTACVDIIGMLEFKPALPYLMALLDEEPSSRLERKLQKAVTLIEESKL